MNHETADLPVVLIVDDDAQTRLLVTETLEPEGFGIEEAASGDAGLEAFQRVRPDLVLLDVTMPGMSGFECCERMRRMPGGERVPIVVLTGHDDDASIARAFAVGATDFVSKPMRWQLLGHRVRYLLRASKALDDLARSQASLAHAQGLAHVGNWEYQPGSADGYWSPEVYRILGLDMQRDPPCFETLLQRVPEAERPELLHSFMKLRSEGASYNLEHRVVRRDGGERTVFQHAEALYENGSLVLLRGTLQDVTERKRQEARIDYLANHDGVTGLANRNLFSDRLRQATVRAARAGRHVAVLVLSLDRFKAINDGLGHDAGNALLQHVGRSLTAALREGDTVARLSGDEFAMAIGDLASEEDVVPVALKLLAAVLEPMALEGHNVYTSASLGISLYPKDGSRVDTLLQNADAAMSNAKSLGGNLFRFYAAAMNERISALVAMESELRRALAQDELRAYFQPRVNLASGEMCGAEALVRWQHPVRGLVPPAEFIPVAEDTGLILPLGEWMIKSVCRQQRAWLDAGLSPPPVAVNLSALQFRQKNLAQLIRRELEAHQLESQYLEMEITESTLMDNVDESVATLHELRATGIKLSLDDFGTGHSSLSRLRRLPIDHLKIDQSFVGNLTTDPEDAAVCLAIIGLAHNLHMTVIAEGVETEGQANYLRQHRCDEMQGYYFSRPLPAGDFEQLMKQRRTLVLPAQTSDERRTLLLVDDEASILSSLTRLLRRDGYEILAAGSAREGLELLATHKVQVIVSDQRMPEMNGTEFLSRVRDLHPDTIRMVLSGYTDLDSITEAINRGAIYKFLTKPWDDQTLRSEVREGFRHHESARPPAA